MEVLRYVEVGAIILAAIAVAAFAVRGYLVAQRLHRLADQVSQLAEMEAKRALLEVETAARRASATVGHIDRTLVPLSNTVRRVERWTAAIAAETLLAGAVSPALAKVGGWLVGLRKVLAR
jgi:outer membrane murein-binding lipoprotein Lpp